MSEVQRTANESCGAEGAASYDVNARPLNDGDANLPRGWRRTDLASLGDYINGFAFNQAHWEASGLPIVRIAQITGSQGIVDRFQGRLPDIYRLSDGDLIFSWSGTLAVVSWQGGPAWLNQHLFKVVPRGGIDRGFLYHVLQASVAEMDKRTHGSTMKHIKRGELREFGLVVPSQSSEQATIARVLDTLDTTIRQTEAIITKLKQVKQGLLHDLLTRGIDANGELRAPQAQAPHLYKQSPLGWIPREWDTLGLASLAFTARSVLKTGPFGSSLKSEHLTETGRPVVTIGSLGVGRFIEESLLYVSEATAQALVEFELVPGDIAFSRVADVGRSVVVEEPQRGWIMSSNFMRISADPNRVVPQFLQAVLAFDGRVKRQMRSTVNSAGRDVASSSILMSLRFAVPTWQEQTEIILRVRGINDRTSNEEVLRDKLLAARSGLMDDLLTGRVRVTP